MFLDEVARHERKQDFFRTIFPSWAKWAIKPFLNGSSWMSIERSAAKGSLVIQDPNKTMAHDMRLEVMSRGIDPLPDYIQR